MKSFQMVAALFVTVLCDAFIQDASAYYATQCGRFISRDPIGYEAGDTNLHRYVENKSTLKQDSKGTFAVVGNLPYTNAGQPTTSKGDNVCRISIHCWTVKRLFISVGSHCGLTLDYNGSITHLDGSGGDTNQILKNSVSSDTTFAPYHNFNAGTCQCLLDYISKFNSKNVPRNSLKGNSNWTLSCMVGNCGMTINWGSYSPPTSYGIPPCEKYKTHAVPNPHNPNICVPVQECEKEYSCP